MAEDLKRADRPWQDEERRQMYLTGKGSQDNRLDAALEELRLLPDLNLDTDEGTDAPAERIRAIIREELDAAER